MSNDYICVPYSVLVRHIKKHYSGREYARLVARDLSKTMDEKVFVFKLMEEVEVIQDPRSPTLHEAESGSGQSTIQTSEPATPENDANA